MRLEFRRYDLIPGVGMATFTFRPGVQDYWARYSRHRQRTGRLSAHSETLAELEREDASPTALFDANRETYTKRNLAMATALMTYHLAVLGGIEYAVRHGTEIGEFFRRLPA